MNPFQLQTDGGTVTLRLDGGITIEHARDLRSALAEVVGPDRALAVDAAGATHLDAASLQVLIAAATAAKPARLLAASPGWGDAFRRYGLANPYRPPTP